MRVAPGVVSRQPDHAQQLGDAGAAFSLVAHAVQDQRFFEDLADGHARVQRGEWVLEHHLHAPAQRPQGCAGGLGDILSIEMNAAGSRLDQPQRQPGGGGFAAAGLADQR